MSTLTDVKDPLSYDQSQDSSLSKRAQRIPIDLEYVKKYSSWPAIQNPYHEKENPKGIINLGTAVSGLMDDVWLERLKSVPVYQPTFKHFRYYQFWGSDDFRQNLANFMNRFFRPRAPIQYENLLVLNGAMLSLDILGFFLADENEVFLCPVPGYNSYFQAGKQRWNIEVVSVPMGSETGNIGENFDLKMETIEKVLKEQKELGKIVRAFILNNPHNPLGYVLPQETVKDIMKFCQRERIHLIADEMYCMSVFDETASFKSVLELRTAELLDAHLMHLIWGFSKDLCLTAYRTGVIHTENSELRLKLMSSSQYQAIPLPVMEMLKNIISDIDWFQQAFVPLNHSRLRTAYETALKISTSMGIRTTKTKAGFFLLADFRPFLKPSTQETCKAFIQKLYENGVYITPGWEMRAEPGWFRIVFTSYSEKGLTEGLQRLHQTMRQWNENRDK